MVKVGGYRYSSQLARMIGNIILARLLTPEEFGIVAIITVFSGFIMIFRYSGINYAVIKDDTILPENAHFIAILFGLIQFSILALISYPVAWFYKDMALVMPTIITAFVFIVSSFSVVPMAVLMKEMEFASLGRINLFSTVFALLVSFVLAYVGFSYWSLIIQEILFYAGVAIGTMRKAPVKFIVSSLAELKENLKRLKSLLRNITGFNIVNYFSRNTDNFLVGKIYGAESLGIYNRAYSFIYLTIGLISGVTRQVAYPSLEALKKTDPRKVNNEIIFIMQVVGILVFPISFICIVFSKELVLIMWGKNWLEVADIIPYFGLVLLTQAQTNLVGELFILKNMEARYFNMGLLNSFLMVSGIVIGVFISFMAVPLFYSIFNLLVFLIILYWAFYKSFRISLKQVLANWLNVTIASTLLIYAISQNKPLLSLTVLVLYLLILLSQFIKEHKSAISQLIKKLLPNT